MQTASDLFAIYNIIVFLVWDLDCCFGLLGISTATRCVYCKNPLQDKGEIIFHFLSYFFTLPPQKCDKC